MNGAELHAQHLEKLKQDMLKEFENFDYSNEYCVVSRSKQNYDKFRLDVARKTFPMNYVAKDDYHKEQGLESTEAVIKVYSRPPTLLEWLFRW